nr:syndecan-like [Rhipicephalus microplus]
MWKATLVILLLLAVNGVQLTAEKVQSTKEKHGDNGMFFIDDPQSDQAVEGSADFEDTDASSGIGDDEDAEGSGDEHLSEEEMGSGTVGPVFVTPKVTVVTDTKHPPKHSAKPKGPALNPEDENVIPELSGPVTSTKGPRPDIAQGPPGGGYDDDNRQSNNIPLGRKQDNRPSSFFAQPGILAAVIGGAVVGLLCAILLVMFIVYRMRKKDEGSYALDEPKRSPTVNSYMRSSNKEFYA